MKFTELDNRMRVYETTYDLCVLPDVYIVVRLDGRSFTNLTRKQYNFEAPFDVKFRDYIVNTAAYLMECGFDVVYAYTQSDEISLLLSLGDDSFNRKLRKINSVLAGEASAKFSLQIGSVASFDSRVCQLPNVQTVIDYFRWRNEDANRNALNSSCYWNLRKQGKGARAATRELEGLSVSAKNEFLFDNGVNFNDLPLWQKRGIGLYWKSYEKEGVNPKTGEKVKSIKRRIEIDYELPMKEEYEKFIESMTL